MSKSLSPVPLTTVLIVALVVSEACAPRPDAPGSGRALGAASELGDGVVTTYADFDAAGAPTAIGIAFSATALRGLPTTLSDGHHCFDGDGDGQIGGAECLATHDRVIPLPDRVARNAAIPFKWVLLNWNPSGHIPPGVYDLPHFDVHFYIDRIENVFAIEPGPCGPEMVRCDQFAVGRRQVPTNYMHPDFADVEAVVPAMGNHLIDLTGPEFNGQRFTRTWIFGTYDGRVTFYEEMVAVDYMLGRPDACFDIKSPPAVALSGYYPTRSCIRYDAAAAEYQVAMEGFVYREASPPASS